MLLHLLIVAIVTVPTVALMSWMIIRLGLACHDPDNPDPQHIHSECIPRVGGLAIALGLVAGGVVADIVNGATLLWLVLLASAPVFIAGLVEDFSQNVSPARRFIASVISAAIAFFAVGAQLNRVDVPLFDMALASAPVVFVATLLSVAGVCQAYNLVDGLNGLAAGIAIIALSAIAIIAAGHNDPDLALVAALGASALAGFFIFNFPAGRIFLGDGGAYLTGFLVAVLSVLLVKRHGLVSAWCPLLLSAYPILETLLTFSRRLLIEKRGFDEPDQLHLHSIIFRLLSSAPSANIQQANANAALCLLGPAAAVAIVAVRADDDVVGLQLMAVSGVVIYLVIYALLRWRLGGGARQVQAQQA